MKQAAKNLNGIPSKKLKKQQLESESVEEYQEPPMCYWCNGTGENRWGTGACSDCRGSGVERPMRRRSEPEDFDL